jgi:hypothetical protein
MDEGLQLVKNGNIEWVHLEKFNIISADLKKIADENGCTFADVVMVLIELMKKEEK